MKRLRYPQDEELNEIFLSGKLDDLTKRLKDRTPENRLLDMVYSTEREAETLPVDIVLLICVYLPFRQLMELACRFVIFEKVLLTDDFWKRYIVRIFGSVSVNTYGPEEEAEYAKSKEHLFPNRRYGKYFWRRYFNILYYLAIGREYAFSTILKDLCYKNSQGNCLVSFCFRVDIHDVDCTFEFDNDYVFKTTLSSRDCYKFLLDRGLCSEEEFKLSCKKQRQTWQQQFLKGAYNRVIESSRTCYLLSLNLHHSSKHSLKALDFSLSCGKNLRDYIYRGYVELWDEKVYFGPGSG